MRSRNIFVIVVLVLLVFVSGCAGNARTEEGDVNFRTGSQGLEMRLLDGNPPYIVYEHDILPISVELFNRGTSPIWDAELYITGFDPNIINNNLGSYPPGNLPSYGTPYPFTIDEAKNQFNREGGYEILEFNSGEISFANVQGLTTYEIPLVVYACYLYETLASTKICVDPEPHRTYSDKPCITQDASFGGGQGAPVSVSHVNVVNMRDSIRLTFTINNVGGGTIVDPYAYFDGKCPTGFSPADIDVVYMDYAKLGTMVMTDCTPNGRIKLNNGFGRVSCTAPIGGTTAFTTPVEVKLGYAYKDYIRKNIQIRGYD